MRVLSRLLAFNRGIISKLALARQDIARVNLSAEVMTNWMPRVLGSMMLRPGSRRIGSTASNAEAVMIPFIYSATDLALLEITSSIYTGYNLRPLIAGAGIVRPSVTATIQNGDFAAAAGWTDLDESGATSTVGSGVMSLTGGSGDAAAIREQAVTVLSGTEHALRIVVSKGTVTLRVGYTTLTGVGAGPPIVLRQGVHSIAFTPTSSTSFVSFSATTPYPSELTSCTIEAAGEVLLPVSTWGDISRIRWAQSGDVVFLATTVGQKRIERQAARSWSLVEYHSNGPWGALNLTNITMAPSALSGQVTVTASKPIFYVSKSYAGMQIRIESNGQSVSTDISGASQYGDSIRVAGVGTERIFGISVVGTVGWTATITLQRSLGDVGAWTDVESYVSTNTSKTFNDTLDNQVIYYRLACKPNPGNYTSGIIDADLAYDGGSIVGWGRIVSRTSSTAVLVDVEKAFGSVAASTNWWQSVYSPGTGYPSAVALVEGRLWWAGKDQVVGSVSDDYTNYDFDVEGDSGPIQRNIAVGPVDAINWLLPIPQLIVGTQGTEFVARSSATDEPLTPSLFALRGASTRGSAPVPPVRLDSSAIFVGRGTNRLYELALDASGAGFEAADITMLVPELCKVGISRLAVQRLPDNRLHCVLADGTVAIGVFDKAEKTNCWVKYTTDGEVEEAVILPGAVEDEVYYVVKRTINSAEVRHIEKWALESEAIGAALTVLTDSSIIYSGASTATMTGLGSLEGETVAVWGNSKDLGTYVVTSGAITLSEAVTSATIGLPYTAQFKSAKLALASANGAPLTQRKIIDHLGLVLADTHAQGLQYGDSFTTLDDLPLVEEGAAIDVDSVRESYDADAVELNGAWSTDSRLCLQAASPRPVTVQACVLSVTGHDKI